MAMRPNSPNGGMQLPLSQKQLAGSSNCPMGCGQKGGITMVQAMHPNPNVLTVRPIRNSFSICYICLARWETAPDGKIHNLRQPVSIHYNPENGKPIDPLTGLALDLKQFTGEE